MAYQRYYTSSGYEAGYEEGYYQGRYIRRPFILFTLFATICKMAFSLLAFVVTSVWVILKACYSLIKFLVLPRK